jgi:hypothetical protein
MHKSTLYTREREQGQRLKRYERRDAKRQFLRHYILHPGSAYPCVSRSCRAIGISRSAYYSWLRTDALFNKKIAAINAVWFEDGNKELQRYGKELIRKVGPQALQDAYKRLAYNAYIHRIRLQMYAKINFDTPPFDAPPDDPGLQSLMHDVSLAERDLAALLESIREQV